MSGPKQTGDTFKYMHGIIIVSGDNNINELACKVKDPLNKSKTFLMEINVQWVNGLLDDWLKTTNIRQQQVAIDRYKLLISWVYTQV